MSRFRPSPHICFLNMPDPTPSILNYASPDTSPDAPRFLRPMFRWRTACAFSFLLIFAGLFFAQPLIILSAIILTFASAIMTLIYIGLLAQTQVGARYAVHHICLTLLLMPMLFLGIWLV